MIERFNLRHIGIFAGVSARRWMLFGGLLALSLALVACEDDGDDDGLDVDVDEDVQPQNLEFVIGEDGIDPPMEEVRVPDRYQVIVNNESSEDCTFFLGGFLRDFDVPAGESRQTDIQLPPDAPDEEELDMGCDGIEERQGTLIVRNATGSDLGVQ